MSKSGKKTSVLAILSLVFAFVLFPVGFVLAIIALIQIQRSQDQLGGKGLAIASLIISGFMLPMMAGCLAAIAIPNFIRYQLKSKESEAKVNLRSILTAQEAFHAQYGVYLRTEGRGPGRDPKAAWDGAPCPMACDPIGHPEACTEFSCLPFEPAGPVHYRYACETTNPSVKPADVTCAAVADLDGDGSPGLFVIGTANGPNRTGAVAPIPDLGAAASCDTAFTPGRVVKCSEGF